MRKFLTTLTLAVVLTFGATFANAGILVAGISEPAPCTAAVDNNGILVAGITGILVAGFTGILVAGVTGILVAGAADAPQQNCGILVAG